MLGTVRRHHSSSELDLLGRRSCLLQLPGAMAGLQANRHTQCVLASLLQSITKAMWPRSDRPGADRSLDAQLQLQLLHHSLMLATGHLGQAESRGLIVLLDSDSGIQYVSPVALSV